MEVRKMVRTSAGAFTMLLFLVAVLPAADRPNFSGTYILKSGKSEFLSSKGESRPKGTDDAITLKVVQDLEKLEISRFEGGRETVSHFSMKSGEGAYTVPSGAWGNGKVRFKGNRMEIESVVVMQPAQSGPRVPFLITEKWELSADSKRLTIHNEMVLQGGGIPGISSVYTYSRN
jgi:hypothetical protein